MDRIKFQVDGYLKGGFPIEEDDIETITKLDFYEELIGYIEEGNDKEAASLSNQNLDAEFIELKNISILYPYIEEINGIKIPLFKYFEASFILEGPKEVISDWMDKEDKIYKFNKELFEEWLDENGGDALQDGCSYLFGGACYVLDGFGCNTCSIEPESIEKAFN